MARKRKVFYPPARNAKKRGAPSAGSSMPVPTVVAIDTTAARGRAGLTVGSGVRILGTGLYAGELAVVERLVQGVIPSAIVRTEAGRTRQARTVDLEPVPLDAPAQDTQEPEQPNDPAG
jgi:hypothetical protein